MQTALWQPSLQALTSEGSSGSCMEDLVLVAQNAFPSPAVISHGCPDSSKLWTSMAKRKVKTHAHIDDSGTSGGISGSATAHDCPGEVFRRSDHRTLVGTFSISGPFVAEHRLGPSITGCGPISSQAGDVLKQKCSWLRISSTSGGCGRLCEGTLAHDLTQQEVL